MFLKIFNCILKGTNETKKALFCPTKPQSLSKQPLKNPLISGCVYSMIRLCVNHQVQIIAPSLDLKPVRSLTWSFLVQYALGITGFFRNTL